MAAPIENLLSPGRLSSTDRNTFTAHRQHGEKHSLHWPMLQADVPTPHSRQHLRVMYLQRRWQELKERERSAQQHNAQLLQQFDRAQDKLREMLARNAVMKTVRIEYERYLEETAPHWLQQIKEKPAQRKRMEEYLTSHLKNLQEEQMRRFSTDPFLLLQGLESQNISAFQNNQDLSSHRPPQTQPQSDGFPTNMPPQPHSSSHLQPPSVLPNPHQLHHLTSALPHHHLWPWQDPSVRALSWSTCATGLPSASEALWSQLSVDKPPQERVAEAEGNRAAREMSDGSGGTHFSQELDMSPVRLSSGRAESGESGSQTSGDETERTKKKRERTRQTSSHRGSCSTEDSSQTSSAIVIPGVTAGRSSESDTSSETSSTGRGQRSKKGSGALAAAPPQTEKEMTNGKRDGKPKEENPSAGDESGSQTDKDAESQSLVDQSEGEEEESDKIQNGNAGNARQGRDSSVGEGSEEEEDEEEEELKNDLADERSQRDGGSSGEESNEEEEEHKSRLTENGGVGEEEERVAISVDVRGDEEETGGEEELEDGEDNERRNQGSASSQDEGEQERDEDKIGEVEDSDEEEDEKIGEYEYNEEGKERDEKKKGVVEEEESEEEDGEDEEEQGGDEAREEEDVSDDSIVSPQENRLRKIHIIPEEAAEDDEGGDEDEETSGSKIGSSGRDEFSEDDIEDLLAPQEQRKKTDEDLEDKDKVKVSCDNVEIFKAEDSSAKSGQQSDSDEFDHFYD